MNRNVLIITRSISSAAALCLCWVSVSANEPSPRRAPGLWEIAVTIGGQPSANTAQFCIDAADDLARTAGGGVAQSECTEARAQGSGEEITIESVCKQGNSTVTMKGTLSGNLDSAYKGQITKNYSPPLYGRSEIKSVVDARRLGECK